LEGEGKRKLERQNHNWMKLRGQSNAWTKYTPKNLSVKVFIELKRVGFVDMASLKSC